MASLICFRYWEFWSLGGLENLYNLLRISESPNLPVAKANIKVILIYIPARSAGGGLDTGVLNRLSYVFANVTVCVKDDGV